MFLQRIHRRWKNKSLLRCYLSTQPENDYQAPIEDDAHNIATDGIVQLQKGNIQKSIQLFQKGLDILSTSNASNKKFTSSFSARHLHNCLGLAKQTQSEYVSAETSLQNAFDLCQNSSTLGMGDDQFIDRTGLLMDLAANLMHQGAFDQADKLLRRSHYTATRAYSPNQELIATVLANQAELEWKRGDNIDRATDLMTAAHDTLSAASDTTNASLRDPVDGTSYNLLIRYSLAKYALNDLTDLTKATQLTEELTSILSNNNDKNDDEDDDKQTLQQLMHGRMYTQRGLLHSLLGDYEKAKEMHDKAYDIFSKRYQEESGMTTAVDVAVALNNKGMYTTSQDEAAELYKLAMHCLKRVPDQRMYQAVSLNMKTVFSPSSSSVVSSSSSSPTKRNLSMIIPIHLPKSKLSSPVLQLHHFVPLTGMAISAMPHRSRAYATTTRNTKENVDELLPPKYARLKYLPRVRPSRELLTASFWKEGERVSVKKHKKKAIPHRADRVIQSNINIMLHRMSTHDAMEGIDHMSRELKCRMISDVKSIPNYDAYHPYEQALIDLTLGSKFPKQKKISGDGKGLIEYNSIIKKAKNIAYKRIDEVTNNLRRRSNKGVVKRKINTSQRKKTKGKNGKKSNKGGEQQEKYSKYSAGGGVGWNLLRDGRSQLESIIIGNVGGGSGIDDGGSGKLRSEWEELGLMISQLRSIPSVHLPSRPSTPNSPGGTSSYSVFDFMCPPVVLVGAPNVGKSSLVSLLSSKSPEVNHYPFTTRRILIGNMEWKEEDEGEISGVENKVHQLLQCQIMDTPGLLHREIKERNNIELLTLASLSYLPSCLIMYVLDLTDSATMSHEEQILLRTSIYKAFNEQSNVTGWVDVCGKADLLSHEEQYLCQKQNGLDHSIFISCHEETGIEKLKEELKTIQHQYQKTKRQCFEIERTRK